MPDARDILAHQKGRLVPLLPMPTGADANNTQRIVRVRQDTSDNAPSQQCVTGVVVTNPSAIPRTHVPVPTTPAHAHAHPPRSRSIRAVHRYNILDGDSATTTAETLFASL